MAFNPSVEVIFKFIAKNPPMACICSAILFFLIAGALYISNQAGIASFFAFLGGVFFIVGVGIHS